MKAVLWGHFFFLVFSMAVYGAENLPSYEAQTCSRFLARQIRVEAIDNIREQGKVDIDRIINSRMATVSEQEAQELLDATGDAKLSCSLLAARIGLSARVACLSTGQIMKQIAAKQYRRLLDVFRNTLTHLGPLFRKYFSGQNMDAHTFRWSVVETLFKEGDFRGSFGHPVYDGMPEVMSPVIFREDLLSTMKSQKRVVGRSLQLPDGTQIPVKSFEVSPMVGVSGMSFPQLTAQSHLSLIYMHLKLAKEQGVRQLLNTGEGGHGFHLAILNGDREAMKQSIIRWNLENKQFTSGSWDEARVIVFVNHLMKLRDQLFQEFSPEDLTKAQVVAQYGSALNGIRTEDGNHVDYGKLREVGTSPYVAMIQYKLKQAAKRGAKVDPKKVDDIVAALREIPRNKPFKSPEVNPDMDSPEQIARLVVGTKMVTGKPVSLKFAVGDVEDAYRLLEFLKNADALPDHLQIEGRGEDFSPGSGNAPPGASTSLASNEALIVIDAILRKLQIRDRIYLESTGDVLLPAEALERMALGADGVTASRLWLGMGLGCAQVRSCANGNCPYGIASRTNSIFAEGLDPSKIAPQGYLAASNWQKSYIQTLAETQVSDWRQLREEVGIASSHPRIRKKKGLLMLPLSRFYDQQYVGELLAPVMTADEVQKYVYNR